MFTTTKLPVGRGVLGGALDVLEATVADQVPGRPLVKYVVFFLRLVGRDGRCLKVRLLRGVEVVEVLVLALEDSVLQVTLPRPL